MTERQFSEKIMKAAKVKLRGAEVLKVADRFTRGIPDIEVLWMDRTSWIETKYQRAKDRLKDICRMDQLVQAHQLGTVCGGRSWIVIFRDEPKRTEVWLPRVLAAHIWPRVVGEAIVDPYRVDDGLSNTSFQRTLINHGCIYTYDHDIDLVIRVMWDAIKDSRG